MKRLAVFVSGQGTGLMALAGQLEAIGIRIAVVVHDRPCPAATWSEAEGLPTRLVDPKDGEAILRVLAEFRVDLVLLSGYMRRVPPEVVAAYRWRMVNIHPSLLPAFPGKDGIGQALAYGVKVTGATLHFVDEEIDHGPIILQEAVPVAAEDDWESLRARLRPVEVRLMREGLRLLAEERLAVEGRRVVCR